MKNSFPESRPLRVSEINRIVKNSLEEQFADIQVLGEASGVTVASSGHLYFTLKDEEAAIRIVMFRGALARSTLKKVENGQQIIVRGTLSLYPPRGEMQIVANDMQLKGIGDIFARLEKLKSFYMQKGYFDPAGKKRLPLLPKRIGIVTSPTGAAVRDIIRVIHRRFPEIELVLFPVKVQGEGAAQEIAAAIEYFNTEYSRNIDVLIVGRGGGSYEDLWAFNEEPVIEAIFRSLIPVISAVGHEIDFTVADFVADVRAATPSAAAEIVIATKEEISARLKGAADRLSRDMENLLHMRRNDMMEMMADSALVRFPRSLMEKGQRLDNLDFSLHKSIIELLHQRRRQFERLFAKVEALDPERILQKGYSITSSLADGKIVRDGSLLKDGDALHLRFAKGETNARVEKR